MAILHRALFTWFIVLVFLILLVLKLDRKVSWNWFLVFVPLWLFDAVMLIYITFKMVVHCKHGQDRTEATRITMKRKVFYLEAVVLKMTFQVLLCLRQQEYVSLDLRYVMVPFWLLMLEGIVDISTGLFRVARGSSYNSSYS